MPIVDGSVPHFDTPFRVIPQGGQLIFAIQEQDTIDDVTNCVEMAVRYRQGQRMMIPSFGISDPVFKLQPLDTEAISAQVQRHEPRAFLATSQAPDFWDNLIARIKMQVSLRKIGA